MNYIVKSGQSIYDIAVEVYGGVAGIKNILIDNPTIDINTYLEENSTIIVFPIVFPLAYSFTDISNESISLKGILTFTMELSTDFFKG